MEADGDSEGTENSTGKKHLSLPQRHRLTVVKPYSHSTPLPKVIAIVKQALPPPAPRYKYRKSGLRHKKYSSVQGIDIVLLQQPNTKHQPNPQSNVLEQNPNKPHSVGARKLSPRRQDERRKKIILEALKSENWTCFPSTTLQYVRGFYYI